MLRARSSTPLAAIPLPNVPGNVDNLQGSVTDAANYWNLSQRFDVNITDNWKVFARYGRVCVHCGAPATDVDHLVPIGVGGDDSLANLRPACARCNRGWG